MSITIFTNNITSSLDDLGIKRKEIIVEKLTNCHEKIKTVIVDKCIDYNFLEDIHDPEYISFLLGCYYSIMINPHDTIWLVDGGVIPPQFSRTLPKNGWRFQHRLAAFYASDNISPIYEHTADSIMISANQARLGAEHIMNNPQDLVYVVTTCPGHHAKYMEYGGYCFINNAVVAAYTLSLRDKRVAILDIDYHAGNGTAELIATNYNYDLRNIVACSIHCDPTYDYPSFEGFADDYKDNNNIINYPVKPKCDIETYIDILKTACDKIKQFDVNMLVIAFGGDTFYDDPDASPYSRFTFDLQDYISLGRTIREHFKDTPIIVIQEGGYDLENIGDIVNNFLVGLTSFL